MCHLVRKDSSAIKFDIVEFAFILAFFYWLNHEPMKKRRKLECLEKTLDDELQKLPHTKAPTKTRTHALALVAG